MQVDSSKLDDNGTNNLAFAQDTDEKKTKKMFWTKKVPKIPNMVKNTCKWYL